MRRRELFLVAGGAAFWPQGIRAMQAGKPARVGFLDPRYASAVALYTNAFRAGLRDLGYVDGENLIIEFRWAEDDYDRLPALARELVDLHVDIIVTHGLPGILAARQATSAIPIVMAVSADAVRQGLVTSLNRPGGNLTGNSYFGPELHAKRLEFLKEALPDCHRIAVLYNPANPTSTLILEVMGNAAKSMNVDLQKFEMRRPQEFSAAFSAMAARSIEGVVVVDDPAIIPYAKSIAEFVTAQRLPTIGSSEIAEAGGLMAYGVNFVEMYRHAAVFVDKILKGAKPYELPVEQPTKFKFVINVKAVKALGLTIPNLLLARADEVLE